MDNTRRMNHPDGSLQSAITAGLAAVKQGEADHEAWVAITTANLKLLVLAAGAWVTADTISMPPGALDADR